MNGTPTIPPTDDRRQTDLPVIHERREPLLVRLAREGRVPVKVEQREYRWQDAA